MSPPPWCAQDWVTPNVGVHPSAYDAFAEEEEKFHLVVKCGTSPGSALALLLNLVQHESFTSDARGLASDDGLPHCRPCQ